MADQVSVSLDIAAPADRVWSMVTDVSRMGEWSPEATGGRWLGGATGPAVGTAFRGTNRRGARRWSTLCRVTESEPGRRFAFRVSAIGVAVSEWRYEFEETDGGCRVTESWTDRRRGIAKALGGPVSGVADRVVHNRRTMEETLEHLKAKAEADA